jgi:hypothetical protein
MPDVIVVFDWLVGPEQTDETPLRTAADPEVLSAPVPTALPAPVGIATPRPTPAEPEQPGSSGQSEDPGRPGQPHAEYTVLSADLGEVIRVRATVTAAAAADAGADADADADAEEPARGAEPLVCLSAPTAVVQAADPDAGATGPDVSAPIGSTPIDSAPVDSDAPVDLVVAPAVGFAPDDAGVDGALQQVEAAVQGEPAASGPLVNISVSSDVLLIGGFAALVLVAAAAVFGRTES